MNRDSLSNRVEYTTCGSSPRHSHIGVLAIRPHARSPAIPTARANVAPRHWRKRLRLESLASPWLRSFRAGMRRRVPPLGWHVLHCPQPQASHTPTLRFSRLVCVRSFPLPTSPWSARGPPPHSAPSPSIIIRTSSIGSSTSLLRGSTTIRSASVSGSARPLLSQAAGPLPSAE